MKKILVTILFVLCCCTVFAQAKQEPSTWSEKAISASISVAKNLWDRLNKEGKPLAQKMLKTAPEYYKGTQKTLQDFVKRVNLADIPKTFSEKQRMALELWKLRGAINVLALSDPQVVKNMLNLTPADVSNMQKDLRDSETKLKKSNLPGI